MPLNTRCTKCHAKYQVPDNTAGKKAKCTKCKSDFVIQPIIEAAPAAAVHRQQVAAPTQAPQLAKPHSKRAIAATATATAKAPTAQPGKTSPAAVTTAHSLTEKELLSAFQGTLERLPPRPMYVVGILLIACTMVLLPLVYLALIGAVSYGVYYHAVNDTALLTMGQGRARTFSILMYVAPLIVGPIAIFFMFKPLLARPSSRERSRSLTRQSEPLLFAFVDQICETVGAPRPTRIDVDCDVNASASFRRGIWSMFGKDLVLTIGLPLVAGMSMREFGGVLAHEFGHFSQGAGMRLSYLVRSISFWFIRVVYQRDQWDDLLDVTAHQIDIRVGFILRLAQLFIWISRCVLWVLMHVGMMISGFMLRQMEFDADRFEARFSGSKSFAGTMRRLHLLMLSSEVAHAQLSRSLDHKKLVDSLPGLIVYHARRAGAEELVKVEKFIADSKTGWFDSHPSSRDRIEAAEALHDPGIFHLDRAASQLFADFPAQCAATTWNMYLAAFGPKVPRKSLEPVQQFATTWVHNGTVDRR